MSSSATVLLLCFFLGSMTWFDIAPVFSTSALGWQHLLSEKNFFRLLVLCVGLGQTALLSAGFVESFTWSSAFSPECSCTISLKTTSSSSDEVSSSYMVLSDTSCSISWATSRRISSFLFWTSFKSSTLVISGFLIFWNEFLQTA